jgi:hypothetical protein
MHIGTSSIGENRFQELIRLRTLRNKVLSAKDETQLLTEAVSNLGVTLDKARGILLSEVDNRQIELESDLDDVMLGMIGSMSDHRSGLSERNFDMIAKYYAQRSKKVEPLARMRVKEIMEENGIEPRGSGWLRSRRWYRRISK